MGIKLRKMICGYGCRYFMQQEKNDKKIEVCKLTSKSTYIGRVCQYKLTL